MRPRCQGEESFFGRLEQEDQRLKKHYGRWMDIVRSLQLESFILTKLTKPLVRVNLVGPQVSLRNGAPRCQGEESFFGRLKQEFPRLKKKHDIRWMDIQRPHLLEPCVVDKALHTRQLSFFRGRVNIEGPQVCGREHIAHSRFVRMYIPFFS